MDACMFVRKHQSKKKKNSSLLQGHEALENLHSFRFRNVTDSIMFLLLKPLQTFRGRSALISTRSHKRLFH